MTDCDVLAERIHTAMGYKPGGVGPNGEHPLSMAGSECQYYTTAMMLGFASIREIESLRANIGEDRWFYAFNS